MNKIIIDKGKCIGCALCVNDCPNACLFLEKGKARFGNSGCIECGHCYAVCPQGAVRMADYECEDEPVVPMTQIDSDTLLAAMRSRRTIRRFKDKAVEEEKIRKIMEAGRYCPTGGNSQNVSYTILGSRQRQKQSASVSSGKDRRSELPSWPSLRELRSRTAFSSKERPWSSWSPEQAM